MLSAIYGSICVAGKLKIVDFVDRYRSPDTLLISRVWKEDLLLNWMAAGIKSEVILTKFAIVEFKLKDLWCCGFGTTMYFSKLRPCLKKSFAR